jgi:hypothetical protein
LVGPVAATGAVVDTVGAGLVVVAVVIAVVVGVDCEVVYIAC